MSQSKNVNGSSCSLIISPNLKFHHTYMNISVMNNKL